jgi:peptide/nickel transport system substrate-binding protein/oligopeptide transport system substrate-binding protein
MGVIAGRSMPGTGGPRGFCRLAAALATLLLVAMPGCRRAAAPAGPPADGVYRLPISGNPVTLDPARFTDADSEGVARRLFNGLVKLDRDLRPAPDLAERWELSPDGLTFTFHLRRGVKFHHGREFVAEDVRYSYERLLRKDTLSHRAWVVEPIFGAWALRDGVADTVAGIETPDPYTVVIRLQEPFGPVLELLAMPNAAIVPKEEVQALGARFGRAPVGTGPFRFVSWRDNDVIELERNPDYFGGAPALKGLRFRVIKEPLVAYQEYRAGRLEHCAVPPGYLKEVLEGSEAAQVISKPTLSTYFIGITMTHDPCGGNLHLRRALNYAVDRKFLCEQVLGGAHVPARGVLPPGLPGYNPELEGYAYDPARAAEEVRLAGYDPEAGDVPELRLYFNLGSAGQQVAEAVQADFKRIGIPVTLFTLDMSALLDATNKGDPDLFRLSWLADFPDADNFLFIFHSRMQGSSGNRAHYSNPRVDDLLDRSRREADPEKRLAILREAERIIVSDAPWVFLSHGRTNLLVKPYVRNFRLTPMDVGASVNQVDFTTVSME